VPNAQSECNARALSFSDQRLQHSGCNPVAAQLGNHRDVDHPKLVRVTVEQKPACRVSAVFDDEMLRARKSRSIIAGLCLVLEPQQSFALCLGQNGEFGFTGSAEEIEEESFIVSVCGAEMNHIENP